MTWPKIYVLSLSMIASAFIVGAALRPIHTIEPPLADLVIPHPFRPRPTPPNPPAPLDESDGKLFARLRGHIELVAEDRASRRVEAALQEAADKLESTNAEGVIQSDGEGEPAQFIGTTLFAGAIIKVIWKVVKIAITALILGVLGSLAYAYWPWIAGGFITAVTFVAAPIAWAGGRASRMSREEIEAIVQLRLDQGKTEK